jgi:hypothetical protein
MISEPQVLIGIAGKASAGKDSVAGLLRTFGFVVLNSADLISAEQATGYGGPTRNEQWSLANDVRREKGADYWVRQTYRLGCETLQRQGGHKLAIVGIYTTAEAEFILNKPFALLLGIDCDDQQERHRRYLKCYGSDPRRILTLEEFCEADARENSGKHPHETNVEEVLGMCQRVIGNNDTPERLSEQVLALMNEFGYDQDEPLDATTGPKRSLERFEDNCDLEERAHGISFLRRHLSLQDLSPSRRALSPLIGGVHAVHHVSDQFARRLYHVLTEPTLKVAYDAYLNLDSHTTDEELACSLNYSQFSDCYGQLADFRRANSKLFEDAAIRNLRQIDQCDRDQFDLTVTQRSLAQVSREGMQVEISPGADSNLWLRAIETAGTGPVPVTEIIKNDRIVKTNRIANSKVSLVIHDAVDHVWFINLLDKIGLFTKYDKMFRSIGAFTNCDIFKRESEMVASISFGTRTWTNFEIGYAPEYTVKDLVKVFDDLFDRKVLEDRHIDAFRHLRLLADKPQARESQSIGFVFSNYITELDEQRRRFGKIKQRDPDTFETVGELDPFGADYLSFFVEAHAALHNRKNKHRDTLMRVHVLFEYHLSDRSRAESGDGLRFKFNPLEWPDGFFAQADTRIPSERLLWIAKHYGFSAVNVNLA